MYSRVQYSTLAASVLYVKYCSRKSSFNATTGVMCLKSTNEYLETIPMESGILSPLLGPMDSHVVDSQRKKI